VWGGRPWPLGEAMGGCSVMAVLTMLLMAASCVSDRCRVKTASNSCAVCNAPF
jgi:hypothetical protein